MDKDLLEKTARDLQCLCAAARAILSDIPELWGDYQKDGMVIVSLSGDNISTLEEALKTAEGR